MAGIAKRLDVGALAIGGFDDHAHLGIILPPKNTDVSVFVQKIKANSSRWMNAEHVKDFQWQEGFGSFSVSKSHTPALVRYIRNQREHHKKVSFADEWARILKKHGLGEVSSSDESGKAPSVHGVPSGSKPDSHSLQPAQSLRSGLNK